MRGRRADSRGAQQESLSRRSAMGEACPGPDPGGEARRAAVRV